MKTCDNPKRTSIMITLLQNPILVAKCSDPSAKNRIRPEGWNFTKLKGSQGHVKYKLHVALSPVKP